MYPHQGQMSEGLQGAIALGSFLTLVGGLIVMAIDAIIQKFINEPEKQKEQLEIALNVAIAPIQTNNSGNNFIQFTISTGDKITYTEENNRVSVQHNGGEKQQLAESCTSLKQLQEFRREDIYDHQIKYQQILPDDTAISNLFDAAVAKLTSTHKPLRIRLDEHGAQLPAQALYQEFRKIYPACTDADINVAFNFIKNSKSANTANGRELTQLAFLHARLTKIGTAAFTNRDFAHLKRVFHSQRTPTFNATSLQNHQPLTPKEKEILLSMAMNPTVEIESITGLSKQDHSEIACGIAATSIHKTADQINIIQISSDRIQVTFSEIPGFGVAMQLEKGAGQQLVLNSDTKAPFKTLEEFQTFHRKRLYNDKTTRYSNYVSTPLFTKARLIVELHQPAHAAQFDKARLSELTSEDIDAAFNYLNKVTKNQNFTAAQFGPLALLHHAASKIGSAQFNDQDRALLNYHFQLPATLNTADLQTCTALTPKEKGLLVAFVQLPVTKHAANTVDVINARVVSDPNQTPLHPQHSLITHAIQRYQNPVVTSELTFFVNLAPEVHISKDTDSQFHNWTVYNGITAPSIRTIIPNSPIEKQRLATACEIARAEIKIAGEVKALEIKVENDLITYQEKGMGVCVLTNNKEERLVCHPTTKQPFKTLHEFQQFYLNDFHANGAEFAKTYQTELDKNGLDTLFRKAKLHGALIQFKGIELPEEIRSEIKKLYQVTDETIDIVRSTMADETMVKDSGFQVLRLLKLHQMFLKVTGATQVTPQNQVLWKLLVQDMNETTYIDEVRLERLIDLHSMLVKIGEVKLNNAELKHFKNVYHIESDELTADYVGKFGKLEQEEIRILLRLEIAKYDMANAEVTDYSYTGKMDRSKVNAVVDKMLHDYYRPGDRFNPGSKQPVTKPLYTEPDSLGITQVDNRKLLASLNGDVYSPGTLFGKFTCKKDNNGTIVFGLMHPLVELARRNTLANSLNSQNEESLAKKNNFSAKLKSVIMYDINQYEKNKAKIDALLLDVYHAKPDGQTEPNHSLNVIIPSGEARNNLL